MVAISSYDNKNTNKEQSEEAYNDSIQGTFFGVSFDAGKNEVIKVFPKAVWG